MNLPNSKKLAHYKLTNYKIENCNSTGGNLYTLRKGEKFFIGPIPWKWLCQASRLPGRGFNVAVGVWHLARLNKGRTFTLSQKIMRELGLNRNAVYHGLDELEGEGLIKANRHRGRNSIITILGI